MPQQITVVARPVDGYPKKMVKSTGAREREIKLGADLDFELPDLRRIVGDTERLPEAQLRTVYFDTDDLRLWAEGLTLRYRTGESPGAEGIWTLKIPADGPGAFLERQEITWPGDPDTVPELARSLLRGIIRHRELTVVVELHSTRRRLVLHDRSGQAWGEVDDDTVSVVGGPRDGDRFRQLEIELRDEPETTSLGPSKHSARQLAGAEAAEVVVKRLRAAGATRGDGQKLAKALGLEDKAARPALPRPPASGRHSSVGDVVRASLTKGCRRLSAADLPLRSTPSDPPAEAVHQARVATRRLRSDLKALGPVLDPVWVRHTRRELKWLGEVLGAVRDADVLNGQLTLHGKVSSVELGGIAELRGRLAGQRQAAVGALTDALGSDRYLILLDRLYAAAARPPYDAHGASAAAPARRVLPAILRRRRKALARKVARAGAGQGRRPSDAELHQIRIRAKQVRYVAETATPVLGKSAARTAKVAEKLQSVLGHHHDAVVAAQWLAADVASSSPGAAFAAGELTEANRRHQSRLRGEWRPVWKVLS
jgi:CHAD domain-containing protein